MASTAESIVPWAVIITTHCAGLSASTCSMSSMPDIPCIFRSVRIRSNSSVASSSRASRAPGTATMRYPSLLQDGVENVPLPFFVVDHQNAAVHSVKSLLTSSGGH